MLFNTFTAPVMFVSFFQAFLIKSKEETTTNAIWWNLLELRGLCNERNSLTFNFKKIGWKKLTSLCLHILLISVCLLLLLFWVGKIAVYQVPVLPYYLISVERIQIDIFLSTMFFFLWQSWYIFSIILNS